MHRATRLPLLLLVLVTALPATSQERTVFEAPLHTRDGFLLVQVLTADGTELEFGLATSSPGSAISETIVARLGEDAELTVGGLPIPTDSRAVWPAARMHSPGGETIAGLIGAGFLSNYEVLVDLPNGRLALRGPGAAAPWEGVELGDPVGIQVLHGSAVSLLTRLAGTEFFTLLDLSFTPSIVSPAVISKLGIDDAGEASVGIGAAEFQHLPYKVRDLDMFRRFDPNGNGFVILGAPLVRDCALEISWTRAEIRTCAR